MARSDVEMLREELTIALGSIKEICAERGIPLPHTTLERGEAALAATDGERQEGLPVADAELIRELRRKPYSRACREAARRLEELTQYRRGTPRG